MINSRQSSKESEQSHSDVRLIYLFSGPATLEKRYKESRRKHPLSDGRLSLQQCIEQEETLLSRLAELADWRIDTSETSIYELSSKLRDGLITEDAQPITLNFQSFGFKHALPSDSDFVFDVRNLPNPYWIPELRHHTGEAPEIIDWLEQQPEVIALYQKLEDFLNHWLSDLANTQRAYLTISIGCTGGRHRSVYIANRLHQRFKQDFPRANVRHLQLSHQR